jgi:hypothetical protein
MKRIIILSVLFFTAYTAMSQAGKYAGSMKKLIGQTFVDARTIPLLKNWTYRQGSVASLLSDPERFMVEILQKGNTYIIFFSIEEDSVTGRSRVLDVIEITNVKPTGEIKAAVCREYKTENAFIVALVRPGKTEYSTDVKKAWHFNRDKRRFEVIAVKNVDCLNEGFDMTWMPATKIIEL